MNEIEFHERKGLLIKAILKEIKEKTTTEKEKVDLYRLLDLTNKYTYNSRLNTKGLITHTIIDSLEIKSSSLRKKAYDFDNKL